MTYLDFKRRLAGLLALGLLPCGPILAAGDTGIPASSSTSMPATAAATVTPVPVAATPAPVPAMPSTATSAPSTPSATADTTGPAASASAPATPATSPGTTGASPPTAVPSAPPGQFVSPRSAMPPASPSPNAAAAAVGSAAGLTQVAMVLVLIVAMIAAIAWLLRRLGMARAAGGSTIRVVSGVTLSNRERILVVEIADQWIVVGVTAGSINTLATMPRQENTAGSAGMAAPGGKNFALWLRQTIDKRNRAAAGLAGSQADGTPADKVNGNFGNTNDH